MVVIGDRNGGVGVDSDGDGGGDVGCGSDLVVVGDLIVVSDVGSGGDMGGSGGVGGSGDGTLVRTEFPKISEMPLNILCLCIYSK